MGWGFSYETKIKRNAHNSTAICICDNLYAHSSSSSSSSTTTTSTSTTSFIIEEDIAIHWGQCQILECLKWRILDNELAEDDSFTCLDANRLCSDPADEVVDQEYVVYQDQHSDTKADDLYEGLDVRARFKTGGDYYAGHINTLYDNGLYEIYFDDGDQRDNVPLHEIQTIE